MSNRPPNGLVYWKPKNSVLYRIGYVTDGVDYTCVKMGSYAGHVTNVPMVNIEDIDWKPYKDHLRY